MKTCSKCRVVKPLSEFGKHVRTKDGLRSHCRECGVIPPTPRQCRHCGSEWLHKGRGNIPRICPTCEATLSWCRVCECAYSHDQFHAAKGTRNKRTTICKVCTQDYARSDHGWRVRRSNQLKWFYGITLEEYEARVEEQGGKCACCKRGLGVKPVVDHCHATGVVRGIVCYGCNTGLGKIGDSAEGAHRAEMYLWQSRNLLTELAEGRHSVAEMIGVA